MYAPFLGLENIDPNDLVGAIWLPQDFVASPLIRMGLRGDRPLFASGRLQADMMID
jgi:hypothetical protein